MKKVTKLARVLMNSQMDDFVVREIKVPVVSSLGIKAVIQIGEVDYTPFSAKQTEEIFKKFTDDYQQLGQSPNEKETRQQRQSQTPGGTRAAFNSAQPSKKGRGSRQDNYSFVVKKTGDLGLAQGGRAGAGTNETFSCLESHAPVSTLEGRQHIQRNKSLAVENKARKVSKRRSKKIAVPRVFETKMQRSLRTEGSLDEQCDLKADCYSMMPRKHVMDSNVSRLKQSSNQRELYARNQPVRAKV